MRSCKLTLCRSGSLWGHPDFGRRLVMLHDQAGNIALTQFPDVTMVLKRAVGK